MYRLDGVFGFEAKQVHRRTYTARSVRLAICKNLLSATINNSSKMTRPSGRKEPKEGAKSRRQTTIVLPVIGP